MARLILSEDNTELRKAVTEVSRDSTHKDISHFNLLFYNTQPVAEDGYTRYNPMITYNLTEIVPAADFQSIDFDKLTQGDKNRAIGISSLVRLSDGKVRHIKQLDIDNQFSVSSFFKSVSDIAIKMAGNYREKNCRGYLVNSGSGYHYYEEGLLEQSQWQEWIENAKKSGLVDKKWINLSLQREYSVLRINSTTQKPSAPVVLCKFALE